MDGQVIKRFQLTFLRTVAKLPLPWILFFAMVVVCAVFEGGAIMPLAAELKALEQQLATTEQHRDALRQSSEMEKQQTPAAQLSSFFAGFPDENTLPDTVENLLNRAQSHDLNPKEAHYSTECQNHTPLMCYQISMPLTGAYPNIKAFLFDVLSNIRNVSLDNIAFGRKQVGDSQVEATVVMTLYLRKVGS